MTTLTGPQTLDMLGDLGAGAIDDVFSQDELQRFYDRAEDNYALAVYYGWSQILANSAKWVDYQVAQTKVSSSQAFAQISKMADLWYSSYLRGISQVAVLGMNGVPPHIKPRPYDDRRWRRQGLRPRDGGWQP